MLARNAENLYWLARYVERADYIARMIDASLRLSSLPKAYGDESNEWSSTLAAAGVLEDFKSRYDEPEQSSVIRYLAFDAENSSSIRSCIQSARRNARAVRTALTVEMWEAINGAWIEVQRLEQTNRLGESLEQLTSFLDMVKQAARDFDGSAYRTMLRNDAYYFGRLGLYIERADNTARVLDVKYHLLLPTDEQVGGSLDYFQWASILRSVSAFTAYNWVYRESIKPWLVADLLVLRAEMPRSLVSCYENLTRFLDALARDYGKQGPAQRHCRMICDKLRNQTREQIFQTGLHEYIGEFIDQNNKLGAMVAVQYMPQ
jgi:uncharacterized alpha-E superfamily protein